MKQRNEIITPMMMDKSIINVEHESQINQSLVESQRLIKEDVEKAIKQIAAGETFSIKDTFKAIRSKYE